jgi:short-subunit dehydrogenase
MTDHLHAGSSSAVCAIVGAGPQLGTSIARRFGSSGFTVALLARNADQLASRRDGLRDEGIEAHSFPADATDPASLGRALDAVAATVGPPSVLVYNAVTSVAGGPSDVTLDTLMATLHVNFFGAVVAVQRVLPAMRQAGTGTVLLTGGAWGLDPSPEFVPLGVGKAAARNFAFALAQEARPWGVRATVVTICGRIAAGTKYDPDVIADTYWQLHRAAPPWDRELVIK